MDLLCLPPSSFSITKFLLFERFIKTSLQLVLLFFKTSLRPLSPDLFELDDAPWDDSHLTSFPNRELPLSLPPEFNR